MATRVIWQLGEPFTDLTGTIMQALTSGVVIWMSVSGAWQILYLHDDGVLTRTRFGPVGGIHVFDGVPVVVEPPFMATTCGCRDGSGYAATEPLLVAQIDGPDQLQQVTQTGWSTLRELIDSGATSVPQAAGHPDQPRGALYCPATAPST